MADPFVAEIRIFPFNFAPRGWAFCNGQLLPISQNTALFSLLGTTYGGDGKSNFALPDMQGNAAIHEGQGPGLSLYDLGQTGGSQQVTLLQNEIPVHTHSMMAGPTLAQADTNVINGNSMGKATQGNAYAPYAAANVVLMSPYELASAGASMPHNNLMPYLTLNFCIALQGVFPARP